jgi:hypothetical protein
MNPSIDDHPTEPIVDDQTLEAMEERETEELIAGLAAYARSLEQQIVQLRSQINDLTPEDQEPLFPELHTDLYESFDHYAAYGRFAHVLEALK